MKRRGQCDFADAVEIIVVKQDVAFRNIKRLIEGMPPRRGSGRDMLLSGSEEVGLW